MRKWLKSISAILLGIALCSAAIAGYNAYRQHEAVQKEELLRANKIRTARGYVMASLGYSEFIYYPSDVRTVYDKNAFIAENYEKFLVRESLPLRLQYYKNIMDEEYPKVGYGLEFPEITVERLRAEDPLVLQVEMNDIGKKINSEYNTTGDPGIRFRIYDRMKADGLDPYA